MLAVTWDTEESSLEDDLQDHLCISWSGISRKTPVLLFYAEALVIKNGSLRSIGERFNLAFKIVRTESRLVRGILTNHGFHEVHPNSNDFNLMWTGSHLKPYLLRGLQAFQKVNHFPRSYELTRKDRLYKNIHRMQQAHGYNNFHFIPQTFMLPSEYQEFCNSFSKDKGPWIIKPVASSRGRGIYLVSNPSQISLDENILVSRYINNPLLIDDFKFDVRLYVLVTSYDPVIIYLYEEGLARFATVKYEQNTKNIKNQFMHLTNYSVNKKSSDYVSCDDAEVEDYGNKWSMSAMLRYLKQQGMNTTLLMGQIEDLVIKALLSVELTVASACKMFIPYRTNCFELYGFDVLIDSNLKPWLLEVNLSPSLACDTPLDLKIKASMISDMLSLIGIVCQDPLVRQPHVDRTGQESSLKCQTQKSQRPYSANSSEKGGTKQESHADSTLSLTSEETKVLKRTQEEYERRGGFVRIFPTSDTWELYSGYLEYKTNMNSMLANRLFPGRYGKAAMASRSRRASAVASVDGDGCQSDHVLLYERKLLSLETRCLRRHSAKRSRRRQTGRRCRENAFVSSGDEEGEEAEDLAFVEGDEKGRPSTLCSHKSQDEQRETALDTRLSGDASAINKPHLSLLYVLQQGWHLSKVQARMAFSCYLQHVQKRLLTESKINCGSPFPEKDNDQMELIIRFLKRAASNLQEDMKMDLPSTQLPLQDRCRILSHQLGEFIRCYNKETHHMVQKLEKINDEERCIDPSVFKDFIRKACENDLEEVLTFYTQKNKSANVFLGTKCHNSKPAHNKTFCPGSGEPERVNSAKWSMMSSAVGQVQDVRMGAIQRENAFENGILQTNRGLQRDIDIIEVKPHNFTISEMQSDMSTSGMKNGELLTTKSGDVRTAKSHTRTEPDASVASNAQHRILVSSNTAALNCDVNNCSSLPQAQSDSHSHSHHTTYSKPQPHPINHAENGHYSPVSSMLNNGRAQAMRSNSVSAPATGTLQAVQSSTTFDCTKTPLSLSTPSSLPIYHKMTSYPSSTVSETLSERSKSHFKKSNPGSGGVLKELDSLSSQHHQQAITTALKNLVEKQAAQQRSTSSQITMMTQNDCHPLLTNLSLSSGVLRKNSLHLSQSLQNWPKSLFSESSFYSASSHKATQEYLTKWDRGAHQRAIQPPDSNQSSAGSYQLHFAIQQLQQQKQKSSQLLCQSRSRHQAILAAHAVNRWPDDVSPHPKTSPLPAARTVVSYSPRSNSAIHSTFSPTQVTPVHTSKPPATSHKRSSR
ncbi:tubulin polyglutamylase TTLL5 isoform X2 [Alosa sapidissima]|uniref:tubulin polyglutamylase TTLL5 isoform X2 n=1 Tax=Alosa sapidissima TaxID=34773 RepID=UPI001C07F24F|nr:tubulin polyglutamylase TTLL5 isoform X2 [Alosa sapidissima]